MSVHDAIGSDGHTRPVTGLSFANEDAYETDCGMSMEATVRPPSMSPPSLMHEDMSTIAYEETYDTYKDSEYSGIHAVAGT